MSASLEETSLAQRIVLCCLADAAADGETPLNTAEIREATTERLDDPATEDMGHLTEADVMRALNGLSETDIVEETRPDDRSPVGKGRPQYALGVDVEEVRGVLSEDDRVARLLD